jgi:hypothetical protein
MLKFSPLVWTSFSAVRALYSQFSTTLESYSSIRGVHNQCHLGGLGLRGRFAKKNLALCAIYSIPVEVYLFPAYKTGGFWGADLLYRRSYKVVTGGLVSHCELV